MSILEIIGKIIIPVLVGVTILGSLQSIKTTSINPQVDQADGLLKQVGGTHVEIGGAGMTPQQAEDQMNSAIVWNMMAASDCRTLTYLHLMSGTVNQDSVNDDQIQGEVDADNQPLRATSLSDFQNKKSNNKNYFYGNFKSFMPLVAQGFEGKCIGTTNVVKQIDDTIEQASLDVLSTGFNVLVSVAAGGIALAGCVGTAGLGCAAAAVGYGAVTYMIVDDGGAIDNAGETLLDSVIVVNPHYPSSPGFDMEGKYGKTTFNSSQSFTLGTDDADTPLLMMHLEFPSETNSGNAPDFWKGDSPSYMLPEGVNPDAINAYVSGFNGYYVRMQNVPVVADSQPDMTNAETFVQSSDFMVCENAAGYIQSNAKDPDNTGEATGEGSMEDTVYPVVAIEDGATSCLISPGWTEVPDSEFSGFSCSTVADMTGSSSKQTVFSRLSANQGSFQVKVRCGGEQGTINNAGFLSGGANLDYYTPQSYLSGCGTSNFNITRDATTSNDASEPNDYKWTHDPTRSYSDGDSTLEGENQIKYRNLRVTYRNNNSANKTFVIDIEADASSSIRRRFVIEDKNLPNDKIYNVKAYSVTGGGLNLIDSDSVELTNTVGENTVKIVPSDTGGYPEVDVKIRDQNVIQNVDMDGFNPDSTGDEIERITIQTLESSEIQKYNDLGTSDIGSNNQTLGLTDVITHGEPEVCDR